MEPAFERRFEFGFEPGEPRFNQGYKLGWNPGLNSGETQVRTQVWNSGSILLKSRFESRLNPG